MIGFNKPYLTGKELEYIAEAHAQGQLAALTAEMKAAAAELVLDVDEDTAVCVPMRAGDVLILHSDGLKTLREAHFRPGLLHKSPLLIAGFLLDRAFRGRDDASIVVIRLTGEREG